jgi:diguanylate cyclase (GGDEF)-like protein
MTSRTGPRGARRPSLRYVVVPALVVLAAALALLWLVGRSVDRTRGSASDSQLVADVQVARATLQGDVSLAAGRAAALARLPRLQSALWRGDAAELRTLATEHPQALLISASGARAGSLAPVGIERRVDVIVGGSAVGRVVTEAPLDAPFLSRVHANLPAGTPDLIAVTERGKIVAGDLPTGLALSAPSARNVHLDGHDYRAFGAQLVSDRPELNVVALSPGASTFLSAWRLPLAVLATLSAIGALALLAAGASRRRERQRRALRSERARRSTEAPLQAASIEILGEKLAAATDMDALSRVILDAAIKATGASGGRVVHEGDTASRSGESSEDVLRVPLEAGEPGDRAALILYPPPNGFDAEAAEVAHWLGTLASTAMHDAGRHRYVQEADQADPLTGLSNRHHFTTTLQREFADGVRRGEPLSVLLSDLDDFAGVTNRLGRQAGDELLKAFAAALGRLVREHDVAARIAGEKFGLLLPRTDTAGAAQIAERLRSELRAEQTAAGPVTASFGISTSPPAASAEELLLSADACLRQAKENGKDTILTAVDAPPSKLPD